jgi:hypothetical protein
MHPSLGLVAWDVQGSGDGYRHNPKRAAPAPSFEDNVSRLIAMGLANRSRAEHVLQGLGNNVVAAVELLLGYYNGPR